MVVKSLHLKPSNSNLLCLLISCARERIHNAPIGNAIK